MFRILLKQLLGFLEPVVGFLPSRPLNKVQECILLKLSDGLLTVRVHAEDKGIERSMKMPDHSLSLVQCIPAGLLISTLRSFHDPKGDMEITVDISDATKLILTGGNGTYKISCEDCVEYPEGIPFPDMEGEACLGPLFKGMDRISFCASTDDIRYHLQGILCHPSDSGLTYVSTDGHRIAISNINDKNYVSFPQFLMHKRNARVLADFFSQAATKGVISWADKVGFCIQENRKLFITTAEFKIWVSLIAEQFPPYKSVLPTYQDPTELVLDKMTLLASIRRAVIFSEATSKALILSTSIDNGSLKIQGVDRITMNEAGETIPCEQSGKDVRIGFNGKYLLEMISAVEGDKVCLRIQEKMKAVYIQSPITEASEKYFSILMPVNVEEFELSR